MRGPECVCVRVGAGGTAKGKLWGKVRVAVDEGHDGAMAYRLLTVCSPSVMRCGVCVWGGGWGVTAASVGRCG